MKKTLKVALFALILGCLMASCTRSADISSDTITVYWTYAEDDTRALYWAGSYEAPASDGTYSWDSLNDHEKTDSALLASSGDTKTFTYSDGEISFEVTALGVTKTVCLEKID